MRLLGLTLFTLLNTVNKNGRSLSALATSNKKRRYRAAEDPLQGWTGEEQRKWYRFGKHGINFLTNLLKTIWSGQPTEAAPFQYSSRYGLRCDFMLAAV